MVSDFLFARLIRCFDVLFPAVSIIRTASIVSVFYCSDSEMAYNLDLTCGVFCCQPNLGD